MPTDQKHSMSEERQKQPPLYYIMPWNPLPCLVLSSKLGRALSLSSLSLCPAAELGHRVSWIPFNPYKRQTSYRGEIAALRARQTTVANHTLHEQPCLKLLEQDVVCFVSCHLADSSGEALTYWRWTEGWLHPLDLSESSAALHTPSCFPASPAVIGWCQTRFLSGFDKLESPQTGWMLRWDEITCC